MMGCGEIGFSVNVLGDLKLAAELRDLRVCQ